MASFPQSLVLATWLLALLRLRFSWQIAHVLAQAMIRHFTMMSHFSCRRRDLTPDLRQAQPQHCNKQTVAIFCPKIEFATFPHIQAHILERRARHSAEKAKSGVHDTLANKCEMRYSDPDDRIFREDLRVKMNKIHCESLIKGRRITSTGQPAFLEFNGLHPLIESHLTKVTLHCLSVCTKTFWSGIKNVEICPKFSQSYGEIRHHHSGLVIASKLRQEKKTVGSKRSGLISCSSNMHPTWSLVHEVLL